MIAGLRATAKALGISHVALKKAADTGRVKRLEDGSFNVEECRQSLERNTHPKQSANARKQQSKPVTAPPIAPENAGPVDDSVAEATRQLEWEKVRRAKLKNDQDEARLVELAAVNAYVAGMIIKARDELTRIGPETRDDLARIADPVECEAIVMRRVAQALEHLAEYDGA